MSGVDLSTYQNTRAIRSAVEREFIIIGEAVSALGRVAPEMLEQISHARVVIGFRNVLTHDYAAVDDETVFESQSRICRILDMNVRRCWRAQGKQTNSKQFKQTHFARSSSAIRWDASRPCLLLLITSSPRTVTEYRTTICVVSTYQVSSMSLTK